jgi:hypothetical protein
VENLIRDTVGISIQEEAKIKVKKAAGKTEMERLADKELKKTNIIYEVEEEEADHDEL